MTLAVVVVVGLVLVAFFAFGSGFEIGRSYERAALRARGYDVDDKPTVPPSAGAARDRTRSADR